MDAATAQIVITIFAPLGTIVLSVIGFFLRNMFNKLTKIGTDITDIMKKVTVLEVEQKNTNNGQLQNAAAINEQSNLIAKLNARLATVEAKLDAYEKIIQK